MDEDIYMDVCVAKSNLEESTVNVSEGVVGESETRVESTVDVVMSSHVCAECTNDVDEEISGGDGLGEVGFERDLRGADGGNDVVVDPSSRKAGVSRDEALLDSGFWTAGGGTLVEERAARESVEREKGGGDIFDEMPKGDDIVLNDGVHDGEIETRIEGSTTVLGSTDGEKKFCMEDTAVINSEEGLEGCSEKVGSIGGEAQDLGAENGASSSTVVFGTLDGKTRNLVVEEVKENENLSGTELVNGIEQGRETDAAEEDAHRDVDMEEAVMESENASREELVKSVEPNREADSGGEDAHRDIGVSDDKIWNPGSSELMDDSSVQTPVVEEADVVVREEVLDAKDDDLGSIDMEELISNSDEKKIPAASTDDERIPVAVSGEVAAADKEEFLCSAVEGMETDTFDENLSFSLEELQGNIERVNGSTENYGNVYADNEVAAMDKKVLRNSENNQQLKLEGCLDQGAVRDVDSNKERAMKFDEQVVYSEFEGMLSSSENVQDFKAKTPYMGTEIDTHDSKKGNELVDNQEVLNSDFEVAGHAEQESLAVEQRVNDVEQVRSDGGRKIEARKQPITFEKVGGSADDHRSDLVSTGQPTEEVVEGEVMAVDDKVPSDQTVESYSGNDHSLKAEVFGGDAEIDSDGGQEIEVEEQDSDTEEPKTKEENFVKPTIMKVGSLVKSHQASDLVPPDEEGEFKVSDLVWGKVRSHPWWPGQIYDPSDASEKAMKYHKKDCFLVAYFGDQTFAWVDASLLKPFYSHFSQVEKQSNSEVFQNAVDGALEEVSRRIELGLACSCIPNDTYDDIKFQMVENTGIRQESSMRDGAGDSADAYSFQPDKLFEYMKALAQSPSGGADRLEFVIAKAQLSSFYRLKGYRQLPEYQICGGLVENGAGNASPISTENLESQRSSYNKRKRKLRDCMYPSKQERSMSDLMSGSFDSLDDEEFGFDEKGTGKLVSPSGKKRKAVDSIGDDSLQDGRKTISLAKVSITTTPQVPKPSFKIGECIRRAASQMTGSPSILKSNSERFVKFDVDGPDVPFEKFEDAEGKRTVLPTDNSSLDNLLSQLHLAARDPKKGYGFLNIVTSFFSDFRNSIVPAVDRAGGKRKKAPSHTIGTPEAFEFEDMNDTYWTDRVIQNGAEEEQEQPTGRNDRLGYKTVPVELGKPVQRGRRSYTRKQYSDINHDAPPAKPPGYVDENAPAELVMNFSEVDSIPSETNLNKVFRRFGPIKESETEVDRETCRARVVFKRCADAEVAYSSAAKFNIFGSMVVNYKLSYSISVPFKASSIGLTLGEDMQLDFDFLGV